MGSGLGALPLGHDRGRVRRIRVYKAIEEAELMILVRAWVDAVWPDIMEAGQPGSHVARKPLLQIEQLVVPALQILETSPEPLQFLFQRFGEQRLELGHRIGVGHVGLAPKRRQYGTNNLQGLCPRRGRHQLLAFLLELGRPDIVAGHHRRLQFLVGVEQSAIDAVDILVDDNRLPGSLGLLPEGEIGAKSR